MKFNFGVRSWILFQTWFALALFTPVGMAKEDSKKVEATPNAFFEFALFHIQKPKKNPVIVYKTLCKKGFPAFRLYDKWPEQSSGMKQPSLLGQMGRIKEYRPPSPDIMKYSSRGLTAKQELDLQKTQAVFILNGYAKSSQAKSAGLEACKLIHGVAQACGGLIWDEQTRHVFTPEVWKTKRIESWVNGYPLVSNHIAIHLYLDGDYFRAITLGMEKFAQPDIVINQWPRSYKKSVGHVINSLCQLLVERGKPFKSGSYALDFDALKHPDARSPVAPNVTPGGKRKATIVLKKAKWEEGDPRNRLLEIDFKNWPGASLPEKQNALFTHMLGAKDEISYVKHNAAVLAASKRAKQKLMNKKKHFLKGLPPDERILVKAPFKTPKGNNEWMWVEIVRWKETLIHGVLMNEPIDIPTLKAGAKVNIKLADVFDYLHYRKDKSVEGNETAKIIDRTKKK